MRIEGLVTGQIRNPSGVLDILSRLDIGDVIRAKVMEMTSGELVLRLFDGTMFKAAAESELPVKPGDLIELTVTGKEEGKVFLETVKKGESSFALPDSQENRKLLLQWGLKPDEGNLKIANQMKNSGLPPTKELFDKITGLMEQFRHLSVDKAAFLASRNIQPTSRNMEHLISLLEGNLKLGSQLEELQQLVSSLVKPVSSKTGDLTETGTQTTALHTKGGTTAEMPDMPASTPATPGRAQPSQAPTRQTGSMQSGAPQVDLRPASDTTAAGQGSVPQSVNKPDVFPEGKNPLSKNEEPLINLKNEEPPINLKDKEFLINKGGLLSEHSDNDLPAVRLPDKAFKASDPLEKASDLLKSVFVRTDSQDLKSELESGRLFKEILQKLDEVRSSIQTLDPAIREDISGRLNRVEDGIRLLNEVNTSGAYLQIPLNLEGFRTTGELYVMKRDARKKRLDPGNVTMLIALDTQNIGHVETLIDIRDKNVSIGMRAGEQEVLDFIKENCRHLYQALSDKGYRLVDIKYRVLEEKTTPLNAEEIAMRDAQNRRGNERMKFDLRI